MLPVKSSPSMEAKSPARLSKSCVLIIVVAGVERFAFKGVASNLVTYLTEVLHMNTSSAAKSISAWNGITLMLPLLSSVLADSYWDRYSTVRFSSFLYIVGLATLVSWAMLQPWMPWMTLFLPLNLISVGQSAYNPSLQAFGADQLGLDDGGGGTDGDDKTRLKSMFFQWWYFGICTGSLLGNSIMSYVQDTVGWPLGFAVPCVTMALSVAAFVCFAPHSVTQKKQQERKQTDLNVFELARSALRRAFTGRLPTSGDDEVSELELEEKPLKAAEDGDYPAVDGSPENMAGVMLRLLPVWAMLLMFAVIFQLPATFFTKQGMMMDHTLWAGFAVPPAMLQSVITVSIILLMPLYDKAVVPAIRLLTGSEKGVNVMQRIGIGMSVSIVAMVIAALVESSRRERAAAKETMSIAWLLPQYVLLGFSDVFAVVGMQEFFYAQVPATMRTVAFGLYQSVFGFGSFVGAVLIAAVEAATGSEHGWFSDGGRLDNYYWFLAVLSAVSFLAFTAVSRNY